MKISISRQSIYILSLSVFLLIFVFVFAFVFLIPEGKEYREQKSSLLKETRDFRKYTNYRDEVLEKLTELKGENRNIINAFRKNFDAQRFEKIHGGFFNSLTIAPQVQQENEGLFSVYEVNTVSQIDSPQSFYDFLDAVNKSEWIIGINFPINFIRDGEVIRSTFTMKVHGIAEDVNKTKEIMNEELAE